MYEKLISSPYLEVNFIDSQTLLIVEVKPKSSELNQSELIEILKKVLELLKLKKPKFYISDQEKMEVVFPVGLQEWIAEVFGQTFVEIGLQKYAYVKPQELIVNLSMEQTIDELTKNQLPFQVEYFDTFTEAQNWISQGNTNNYLL
jgi:hypothetical protein